MINVRSCKNDRLIRCVIDGITKVFRLCVCASTLMHERHKKPIENSRKTSKKNASSKNRRRKPSITANSASYRHFWLTDF